MGCFRQQKLAGVLFFCLAMQNGWAADSPNEQDYFQELPVVLSASRLSQPLSEAPNAMTVIDRKMIVASGFRTIADLFKLVPGMYVSYYKGSQPFVSYHGATDQYARRMQVMIDGRSVYLPPVSTVDWADLPITIDDIERIEVIRGPAAASHGANSTQGVISITTNNASGANGRHLSITRGSKGINDVSARFGKNGEVLDYRMTLAYSADNGYDNLSSNPNNIPLAASGTQLLNNSNDSNQARLLNYRADYHPNSTDSFDMQFGFNHNVQGVGFNDKNPTPAAPNKTNGNMFHDLFTNSGFLQLGWIHSLTEGGELNVRYSHMRHDQHETLPIYYRGVYIDPVQQSVQTGRDEIEVQHTLPFSSSNRLVYGTAYRVDRISGRGYIPLLPLSYSSSFSTSEYRVFAHDEWRISPRLLLNSGAMLERDHLGYQRTSPRIALNFHATPQQTFRIGASIAYRTPSFVETQFNANRPGVLFVPDATVTSPGLLPERMLSREIGYIGEFPGWSTSLDARLFSDQLSNGTYLLKPTAIFENGMSAVYRGVEATLKHSFGGNSQLTLNFAHELARSNGAALYASGQRAFSPASPNINDVLSGSTPRNSASVLYSQRLAHDFSFSFSYYLQDAMQPFDRGIFDYQPTQRRMDVRIAKTFYEVGRTKGEVALAVQNLFNQGYTEYIANNVFNRRGYVTLALNW